mgnify:CR=1 FL=1
MCIRDSRQTADHDTRILVVNDRAVIANQPLAVIVCGHAPRKLPTTAAAEFHVLFDFPVSAFVVKQRASAGLRLELQHPADQDDVIAPVMPGLDIALERGQTAMQHR